ncbi:MAG: hypothetical protein IPL61_24695 [Myxococcales bacterium]|nr:hypothetical protein [Myxococcales bacterium]
MQAEFHPHLAFHFAGARTRGAADAVDADRRLRPALLAAHRDLAALRYDFPLVLVDDDAPDACVRSLSEVIDALLQAIAPRGTAGERTRLLVLRLERAIRAEVAAGAAGSLTALWASAAARIAATDPGAAAVLAEARAALTIDGALLDCGAGVALRLVTHLWRVTQRAKVRRLEDLTRRLALRLREIIRAHHLASPEGRSPAQLAASFGPAHGDVFDFAAMSRVLTRTAARPMPAARVQRVRDALAVLEAHELIPSAAATAADGFVFDTCAAAVAAHRARRPAMRRLAKAIAIAELEVEGLYDEARHDRLLDRMFERDLRPGDRELFPDFLVCLDTARTQPGEGARLLELLSSELPVKVVVEADDLFAHLSDDDDGDGPGGFGVRVERLAAMAMGLGQVHVVQAPGASLYAVRDRILGGIAAPGSALVSVFSGASRGGTDLPAYLVAGAALQGRAFPVFSFDPKAGPDWATRFSIVGNPQPERAWPVHALSYADGEQQRVEVEQAFTYADFAACDRRYAGHLAAVPHARGGDALAPVAEVIAGGVRDERVPFLLMVDGDDVLARVIVDERVVAETRACAEAWRSLQELGGIHNSHAARLLAREQLAWAERERTSAAVAAPATAAPAGAAPASAGPAPITVVAATPAVESAAPPTSSDDPYIETARCTTCNECTRLNDRMFAYDGNKQAYIANPDAGTFAQLVQAAESCQISIIHPGKPRDLQEPGLAELIERAQLFQ